MMFKALKILVMVCIILFGACSKEDGASKKNLSSLKIYAANTNELRHEYMVETANTRQKMYNGLMGRSHLDADSGMIFDVNIVPKDMDVAMWMKDTLIPLDILFVDATGVIFQIHHNAQPLDETPIYPTKRPRAVLEINGGQADALGLQVGDMLKNDLLGNN